jgi:hypothetical protein
MKLRDEAADYCELIDVADTIHPRDFMRECARLLASLVAVAYSMDQPDALSDTELPASISHDEWLATFKRIQKVLDDPAREAALDDTMLVEDHTRMVLLLPDALADVWRDLKGGLDALASGDLEDEVLWQWWFGFYSHWGRHAVDALSLLHQRIAEGNFISD